MLRFYWYAAYPSLEKKFNINDTWLLAMASGGTQSVLLVVELRAALQSLKSNMSGSSMLTNILC
jgi:hypothetical protein